LENFQREPTPFSGNPSMKVKEMADHARELKSQKSPRVVDTLLAEKREPNPRLKPTKEEKPSSDITSPTASRDILLKCKLTNWSSKKRKPNVEMVWATTAERSGSLALHSQPQVKGPAPHLRKDGVASFLKGPLAATKSSQKKAPQRENEVRQRRGTEWFKGASLNKKRTHRTNNALTGMDIEQVYGTKGVRWAKTPRKSWI